MGLSARRSGSILRAWGLIPRRSLRAAGFARTVGWGRIQVLGRRWAVVVQRVVRVTAVGDVVERRVLEVGPGGAGGFEHQETLGSCKIVEMSREEMGKTEVHTTRLQGLRRDICPSLRTPKQLSLCTGRNCTDACSHSALARPGHRWVI